MSKEKLLELLKDARERLAWYIENDDTNECDYNQPWLEGKEMAEEVVSRIDSTLADANAPTVVVWKTIADEGAFWEAYPDAETGLDATQYEDGRCRWTASIEREDGGYCNSLAEAKAAAEAAMKRLK
jgi:hypothetical protein